MVHPNMYFLWRFPTSSSQRSVDSFMLPLDQPMPSLEAPLNQIPSLRWTSVVSKAYLQPSITTRTQGCPRPHLLPTALLQRRMKYGAPRCYCPRMPDTIGQVIQLHGSLSLEQPNILPMVPIWGTHGNTHALISHCQAVPLWSITLLHACRLLDWNQYKPLCGFWLEGLALLFWVMLSAKLGEGKDFFFLPLPTQIAKGCVGVSKTL